MADLSAFLTRLRLRSAIGEAEATSLLAIEGIERPWQARRDLVRPGRTVDHAVLVVSGIVGRFGLFADGRRQITAIHLPGDMADLHSVAVATAGWGLTALTDAVVLEVPHADLRRVAHDHDDLAMAFWRDTVVDASILSQWVSVMAAKTALERLAHLLCELGIRIELADLGTRTSFVLPFPQVQLADILGITPIHLNRVVGDLRRRGLVETLDKGIRTTDHRGLCDLSNFDARYLLLED